MSTQSVAFAQLTKIDVEKRLVYGRAAQETPDHAGEVMDYAQSKPNFIKWSEEMSKATNGASQGNLRSMHGATAAGKIQELIYNDDEHAIDVVAKVVDDNEWEKCLEGVYTGFSIGGKYGARVTKGDFKHYEAIPSEISLVDRPCIPTATFFDIQKADGTVMQKAFQGATDMTKEQPIEYTVDGTPEQADALAKLLHDNNLSIADALVAVEKSLAPPADEADALTKVALAYADELAEFDAGYASDIITLEKGLAKDIKYADAVNKKYPIENEAHIRAAWNYINKAKSAEKYTPEALEFVKSAIVAAWKEKIDAAGPNAEVEKAEDATDLEKGGPGSGPQSSTGMDGKSAADHTRLAEHHNAEAGKARGSKLHGIAAAHQKQADFHTKEAARLTRESKKSDSAGELKKDIYSVNQLGQMLQSLYYLTRSAAAEAGREQDGSDVPARLADVAKTVAQIYKDMATEEADELLENIGGDNGQPEVMQMAYGLAASLAKAGARNSAADQEMLQKLHDLSNKLGANCATNNDPGAAAGTGADDIDADDSAKDTNLQMASKVEPVEDLTKIAPDSEVLQKAIAAALEPLNKALADATAKIEKLEAMPAPAKGVLRVVDKTGDVVEAVAKADIAPVVERDGSVNEAASAFKKIHASGGAPLLFSAPKTN